ncbi:hypothetical protein [Rubellicoccus peritrichatus]|uniref:Uncharacterized protein n=1 Tax=Rubellicoccus peritrichatus TaxID=3080537 RepID=A0AAQ3LD35_9BACT|nr:hypothetical protein [Puniceicoccus sp. CR14]WOO42219.1 hypothetical protein RZN69_03895 [Puniceicoccus sp. CR14]
MTLDEQLEELLVNLVERRQQVGETLVRLDSILETQKASLDAKMVHFLQRRSYEKALAFVRGESPDA